MLNPWNSSYLAYFLNHPKKKSAHRLALLIRHRLNSFENQDYKTFFSDLSEKFDKNSAKEQSLICVNFEEKKFEINPKEIIKNMHIHGFRY